MWQLGTPAPATTTEHTLPRLLLLAKRYASKVTVVGGACIPHELRRWIEANIGQGMITEDEAELALEWCIGAATTTDVRSNILAFNPNTITAGGANFDS